MEMTATLVTILQCAVNCPEKQKWELCGFPFLTRPVRPLPHQASLPELATGFIEQGLGGHPLVLPVSIYSFIEQGLGGHPLVLPVSIYSARILFHEGKIVLYRDLSD